MFFILTGEVLVTQLTFDKMNATFVDESKNILSSGDFSGHLALIYNTTRNATCKTQSKFDA
jgi:CRP-like cAMP-binding protein